jgi:hypothetical protein
MITQAHRIINGVNDPFGGLLASFQLALEAEGKSPKTLDNYSRAVVQFALARVRTLGLDVVELVKVRGNRRLVRAGMPPRYQVDPRWISGKTA